MIPRERTMKRIRPFINTELIKVITGMRRCGKSVMLELIKDELRAQGVPDDRIISFNFEQFANAPLCTATALHAELTRQIEGHKGKFYLFFDEIQEVTGWEKCINSCRLDFDCDLYITGSNASLLSGELATYLGGRYVEFVMYPFSFEEFLLAQQQKEPKADAAQVFRKYLELGGMPSLTNLSGSREVAAQYLKDLYNSIILKDVVRRTKIRDVDLLERIVTFVLAGVGHPFSATSIAKYFKSERRSVSHDTIMNYVKACTDAFLFYKAPREDLIGKNILSISEKYYVADHGLREAVYGQNARDIDQTLENIIFLELLRRGWNVTVGRVKSSEIDFVARREREKIYVQVCYLLAGEGVIEREFGAYRSVHDNYPKYVVSLDEFDFSRDGIRHMNAREFLLSEEWR